MLLMLGALEYVTLMSLNSNSVAISAMSLFPMFLISSVEGLFGWCGRCICRVFLLLLSVLLLLVLERGFFGNRVTIGSVDHWAFCDCFWKILVSECSMCPLFIMFSKRKSVKWM